MDCMRFAYGWPSDENGGGGGLAMILPFAYETDTLCPWPLTRPSKAKGVR